MAKTLSLAHGDTGVLTGDRLRSYHDGYRRATVLIQKPHTFTNQLFSYPFDT